jgi:hypothetical protein
MPRLGTIAGHPKDFGSNYAVGKNGHPLPNATTHPITLIAYACSTVE